ncbi:MAG: PEGA domain-containing protein, partial [Burkholderiales bacterium]
SRSFYEVVSCLSLDYASLFSYVGARTDKHVREHEVYSVNIGTDAAQRVIETSTRRVAPRRRAPRLIGELTDVRPFGVHRMAFVGAPLAFALLLSGGVAVRAQLNLPQLALRPPPATVKTAAQVPAGAAARVRAEPASTPKPPPAPAPAVGIIQLAVLPWGEVFVNGKSRGSSPPLRSIEVAPGSHAVEIRNTSFPAFTQRVEVRPGQSVRISHRFH